MHHHHHHKGSLIETRYFKRVAYDFLRGWVHELSDPKRTAKHSPPTPQDCTCNAHHGFLWEWCADSGARAARAIEVEKNPDPPILAFFDFLAFFLFRFSLLFWSVFAFFSKDLRGSAKRKKPLLFGGFPLLFPKRQGLEGQGS